MHTAESQAALNRLSSRCVTRGLNLERITESDRGHLDGAQTARPRFYGVLRRGEHRDGRHVSGCQRWGWGGRFTTTGTGEFLAVVECSISTARGATRLCILATTRRLHAKKNVNFYAKEACLSMKFKACSEALAVRPRTCPQ